MRILEEGKVSVVIPIYNVEKYLDRCVKSVVNQTYKKLEIILVDDGSVDLCPQMCDEWALQDKRIKVIHKSNEGLGKARNTGIENATGEYICFLDSDDYIERETIEITYSEAKRANADMVKFGCFDELNDGTILKESVPKPVKWKYLGHEVVEEYLPLIIEKKRGDETNLRGMSVCSNMYSMQLLNDVNWRLVSERDIISEDSFSLLSLIAHVNCVAVIPKAFYHYCRNPQSLSRVYNSTRYEGIKRWYDKMQELCKHCGYSEIVKERIGSLYLSFIIGAFKSILKSDLTKSDKKNEMRKIVIDPHMKMVLSTINKKEERIKRRILIEVLERRMIISCLVLISLQCRVGDAG